jgi:hypothetical protein
MRLKHGKKYETADGVVVGPMIGPDKDGYFEANVGDYGLLWDKRGKRWIEGKCGDLIRRHYTKPKPAHKLDLKPGDVVELVVWEDGHLGDIGLRRTIGVANVAIPSTLPKGKRPLFNVVSRSKS